MEPILHAKSTLNLKQNANIEPYAKALALLKRNSKGLPSKKSKSFIGDIFIKYKVPSEKG